VTKALQPDDLIAHYRVIRALGAGGMGEVYLARDSTLDRDVALKVLPQLAQDGDRVRRFIFEARSASSLNHPHIITVYEIGCEPVVSAGGPRQEKVHYIAMEVVDGAVLGDIIHDDRHRTDLKTVLGYLAQAADGLAKAHASGIVHRDLKPGNIMVSKDGYAKVLDFGLAKLVETGSAPDETVDAVTRQALTVEGMMVGTLGYMAPEQVLGRAIDHRSDIFSFGCILYEAITRRRPFAADSQFEVLQRIVHEHPAPIESVVPDAPPELRQLVTRCLAKAPEDRVQGMPDVAAALRRAAGSFDGLARPSAGPDAATVILPRAATTVILPAKGIRSRPAIAAAGIAILALAAFLVYKFAPKQKGGLTDQALSAMTVSQILSNENLVQNAVAPSGKFAAYITTTAAKRPGGGSFQASTLKIKGITNDGVAEIVKDSEMLIVGLSFTPEGDELYFIAQDAKNPLQFNLWKVPSIGGTAPVEVLKNVDTEVTFDRDGKRFAFMRGDPANAQATALIIYDITTRAEKVAASVKSQADAPIDKPRWSPDGAHIAMVSPANPAKVVVVDANGGGEPQDIGTWDVQHIDSVAWMGPDGLIVAAGTRQAHQLWHVSFPGGERRRLINDTYNYQDVGTSTDGRTVTARRSFRAVQMWMIPSAGSPEQMTPAPIGSSGPENIQSIGASDDGSTIVFVAPKESTSTLWAAGGNRRKNIVNDPLSIFSYKFLRGRNATAFTGFGSDFVGHVYRADIDGRDFTPLTSGSGELLVAVSPDGKTILYNTPQVPRTLLAMPADGGAGKPLVTDYIDQLIISKDSSRLSYNRLGKDKDGADVPERVVLPLAGGPVTAQFETGKAQNYDFTPDGAALTYIEQNNSIWKRSLAGGSSTKLVEMPDARIDFHRWIDPSTVIIGARATAPDRPAVTNLWRWTAGSARPVALTTFPTGFLFEFGASTDGKTVYFIQGALNRDIVRIRGLK
jgi:Tol biopolymer transport system component